MSDNATIRLGGVWEGRSGHVMAIASSSERDGALIVLGETEDRVRSMTKTERRVFLKSRGWERVSGDKAESWKHATRPDVLFSLGSAIRLELTGRRL